MDFDTAMRILETAKSIGRAKGVEVSVAIMDAAERRIRLGGFNGFSFREIAADVGMVRLPGPALRRALA